MIDASLNHIILVLCITCQAPWANQRDWDSRASVAGESSYRRTGPPGSVGVIDCRGSPSKSDEKKLACPQSQQLPTVQLLRQMYTGL
jgi:hypothetical protein